MTVTNQVFDGFKQIKVDPSTLQHYRSLDDHGVDSQEAIELHCVLEKIFNTRFPCNFITKDLTINDLIKNIEKILRS
ncbi:MAG: hypothetical protein K0S08_703 [Gammaproteobacteria bacterium]|jgi:acyl carrier protein|nr:hypothetical protein [Gammaproteobacteria bacterium]